MHDGFALATAKISKIFGSHAALQDVDFRVRAGEVHGVLGENGAGKSTLMNVLYGLYQPSAGEIFINDRPVVIRSPADSIGLGIGMVHQQSALVPSFNAVENFMMGSGAGKFDASEHRTAIAALARKYAIAFPLDVRVGELDVGMRQKIEILRALYRGAQILILDEPTTFLVESEFQQLKESLRELARQGFAVILITHKIREVLAACDTVSVLRKGKLQSTIHVDKTSGEHLVRLMFADQLIEVTDAALPQIHVRPRTPSEVPLLRLEGVHTRSSERSNGLRDVNLEVRLGEILGVAGIEGQKDLAEAIINPSSLTGGDVLFKGKSIKSLSTTSIFNAGIAYTPGDRIKEGILPTGDITSNVLLPHHGDSGFLTRHGFTDWRKARSTAREVIRKFNVAAFSEDMEMRRLSGGNMQKVILGRALVKDVQLLVTHNPSSGLDVSSLEFIFRKLVELRDAGRSVLFLNEDLDELMLICDRIAVLHGGRIVAVRDRADTSKVEIGSMMATGRA